MQKLINRRDFLVTSTAGLTASGASLFSFPLSVNAQGNRSAQVPRGTYVQADARMDLLYLSGTTALDLYHLHPHVPYEITVPEDIRGQTHMCMRNIKEILDDQSVTWRDVVKVNRFQTDLSESDAIEEVMAEYFDFWDWWPAMTTMKIRNLSSVPTRLEMEAIAVIPG
ncbi:MAG: hypothetical protein CMM56_09140 [Rhodospirillaceae bacterium]|nr:hypothetical protein [Rhodospirillaceae bacterium]|tara:strand:+ start:11026 stop:11529 length:504 start_codon:yes stop_codon:yes gene_type:complete